MKKLIWMFFLFTASVVAQHSNTLTWSWSQGTGDAATGFIIQKAPPCSPVPCTGAGTFTTLVTTTTPTVFSYVDTVVTAGQTWFYQVLAYNTGGLSLPSNIISATTPFLVPGAPNSLQVVSK
jgi:hypothetical protein